MFAGVLLFGLHCNDPVNPFDDTDNAKASVYTRTFDDRDTVSIFSAETLAVVIYLKEHLREVVVHIDHNRLWSTSDTTIALGSYSGEPLKIPFSFYDTGWQKIEIRSLQHSEKFFNEQYSLYARSPLYQKTIQGDAGDTVLLKTEPVGDAQVLYVWDFHDGTIIKEYTNETPIVLKRSFASTIGELYVTDPRRTSPSVPFAISAAVGVPLELVCLNETVSSDSVATSQATFTFKVAVNGTEHLKSATLNGTPFDDIKMQGGSLLLSKTIESLDTLKGVMEAVVVATDDRGTTVEKIFFIHYDKTVVTEAPKIVLTGPAIVNDTGYSIQSPLVLHGDISGTLEDEALYLQTIVNGSLTGLSTIVADSTGWSSVIELTSGWNLVQLRLAGDSAVTESVIAVKAIYFSYNPDEKDSVAPTINEISINGIVLSKDKNIVGRSKNVVMRVAASDNKQVTLVTINGEKASADEGGLVFDGAITLVHDKAGEQYIVCAEDSAENRTCDTITARYNMIPEIIDMSLPATMSVDSEYVFTLHAADPDSDVIVATIALKGATVDTVLTVVSGVAHWTPALQDTGALRLQMHVSDPFFEGVDTAQTIYVLANKEQIPPVSLTTVAADFPDTLIAGDTPLSVIIRVDSLTGERPLTYSVYLKNPSRKLYSGSDSAFTWSPGRADAGVQTLQIVVVDKAEYADTLNVLVKIVAHPAATAWFAEDTLSAIEGDADPSFGIRLSKPLADTVRIPYKIVFGTATAPDVVLDSAGVVTFVPGDTLVNIPLKIVDDTNVESEEKLSIVLPALPPLSGKDSLVVDRKNAELSVLIEDNDNTGAKVGVMLQPETFPNPIPEPAGDFGNGYPAVVLTEPLPFDLTVTVKPTAASTAKPGSDYTTIGEDIVLKAGSTVGALKLILVNDWVHENTEVIEFEIVKISNTAMAYIFSPKTTRIVVTDDD